MSDRVVLFDGVCNLCNASVRFIIRRDPEGKIKFAALQSPAGQSLLSGHHLLHNEFYTIVFIRNGKVYQQSDAVLQITRELGRPWPLIYSVGRMIPHTVRDWIYKIIATNRYKIFGRKSECMIPTADLRSRFL